MSNELKPCPCCKGKASIYQSPYNPKFKYVMCTQCLLRTEHSTSLEELVEDWNTRPDPWLPYPENKPERSGKYLITHIVAGLKFGKSCPAMYNNMSDVWFFYGSASATVTRWGNDKIIAFMPLPAPYKKEGE